jgi:hypothetical protein
MGSVLVPFEKLRIRIAVKPEPFVQSAGIPTINVDHPDNIAQFNWISMAIVHLRPASMRVTIMRTGV